ncbi:RNA polymerase II C-terminal domain phosphatase-like 3 isoform X2 [Impatiens glandulifera]|uniref:RNA polymerase II C-terminal domain phosphatase-like 3 isoform X2 n=1 Tax=Impatiens glandulifera TaxID=253017 RepID=UPI001FB09B72|nr:RNA polymerase II C-terminal domain phosphatase-like 3 isoform X2 [Impatiens glandulifera]
MAMVKSRSIEEDEKEKYSVADAVEEITEEEFNRMSSGHTNSKKSTRQRQSTGLTQGLCTYQLPAKYASSLFSLAWAQAVRGDPHEVLPESKSKPSESDDNESDEATSLDSPARAQHDMIVIDLDDDCPAEEGSDRVGVDLEVNDELIVHDDSLLDGDIVVSEKEDGELANGDIVLESDVDDSLKEDELMEDSELLTILGELEAVTLVKAESSFGEVCTRLHDLLVKLQEVLSDGSEPGIGSWNHLSFTALQTVNYAFISLSQNQKVQHKSIHQRLLSYAKRHNPTMFLPAQIREDETEKICMKPSELGSGSQNAKSLKDYSVTGSMSLLSGALPDISSQFTTKQKNNIVSVTQTLPCPPSQSSLHDHCSNMDAQLLEGFSQQQIAAIQKERMKRIEEQKKLFSVRKLCLVLDLDHTILNSARFAEVDPVYEEILKKREEQECGNPNRLLFRIPHMGMWTKLRPGIWNFLKQASKLFELHLYTMGNKMYATEMAKLLDPKGVLFAGRVMSRGDDDDSVDAEDRFPKVKDLDGVLGMESNVIIMDDTVRVWPYNRLNLIAVERYIYFPCSRRQFGVHGPSLLEIDRDERPEDGTLATSLAVIERIHKEFFSQRSLVQADVRSILASQQRKILSGCRIVFSRVFPVDFNNYHKHHLWLIAEQFGAECTNQIDHKVTHVVANAPGTDKVNWALSNGRFVVSPGWVEASAFLYRRANEKMFAIKLTTNNQSSQTDTSKVNKY